MTLMDQIRRSVTSAGQSFSDPSEVNVGNGERMVSVASGGILTLLGLGRRSIPGLLIATVGGMMVYRGVTGQCSGYRALDINTAE